jgi:hypothetical protein
MPKSNHSRFIKFIQKLVILNGGADGNRRVVYTPDYQLVDAPPYKVGKEFPYKNAGRALREGVKPEHLHLIDAPHLKSAEQLDREATYLGRNRSFPRPSNGKHGGDGTMRRSSGRRPFRGDQPFQTFRDENNRLQVVKPVAA